MLKNALIFLLLQSRIKLTIEDQEKDIGDRDIALERAFKFYKALSELYTDLFHKIKTR